MFLELGEPESHHSIGNKSCKKKTYQGWKVVSASDYHFLYEHNKTL